MARRGTGMETRYPKAVWRPLGAQSEPLIGVPRILVFHTMVGSLKGSDAMFHRDGYTGTESHFGVGGPQDGPELDGAVWQWQSIDRQADAQNSGNAYCTSIETADGGDPTRPWSEAQLRALIALGAWWCRQTGARPRLVQNVTQSGFGYHAQFRAWAPDGRSCPGAARIRQLTTLVIPGVAAALTPTTSTPIIVPASTGLTPKPITIGPRFLSNDGAPYMHGADVAAVQKALGFKGKAVDGIYGPQTALAVRTFQNRRRLQPDAVIGPATAKALGLKWRAGSVSA